MAKQRGPDPGMPAARLAATWPEDEVLARIWTAVGVLAPITPDWVMLRSDLRCAVLRYRILAHHGNEGVSRSRKERLLRIEGYATKLIDALAGAGAQRDVISLSRAFPEREGSPVLHLVWDEIDDIAQHRWVESGGYDPAPSFEGLRAGLQRLRAQASDVRGKLESPSPEPGRNGSNASAPLRTARSPLDLLVTKSLSEIYRRHVGREAGVSRSEGKNGEVGGPFLRFVQATLAEMGVTNGGEPYSPETLARLVSAQHTRRYRTRRRGLTSPKGEQG